MVARARLEKSPTMCRVWRCVWACVHVSYRDGRTARPGSFAYAGVSVHMSVHVCAYMPRVSNPSGGGEARIRA